MVDILKDLGVKAETKDRPPIDIFSEQGISPPSIGERNSKALSPTPVYNLPDRTQMELQRHQDEYEMLAKSRYTDDEIAKIKNKGPIGFLEAIDFIEPQDVIPGGGFFAAADTFELLGIAEKLDSGEEISTEEKQLLDNYVTKNVEMNLRGLSVGGGIAYYGASVPAFGIEFWASGGLGKIAQKGAQEAAEKAVGKSITSKIAGTTANIVGRSAALPGQYAPQYAEQRLNDFISITDKGAIFSKESKDSPATSALKAFAYTNIEVASELSGAALGKYFIKPVTGAASKVLKTPLTQAINQVPAKVRNNLYKAYKAVQPNAKVSSAFTAAGWNGMLNELGEERVADVLRATLNLSVEEDYTTEDFLDAIVPDKDQLLIEAGIISILGGVKTSADLAFNIIKQKTGDSSQAKEIVDNMSSTELDAFVEQELKVGEDTKSESTDPVIKSQIDAAMQSEPTQIIDEESNFNRFYREFSNTLQPIEGLTAKAKERGSDIKKGKDAFLLSRTYAGIIGNIEQNLKVGATRFDEETGQYKVVGKALKSILDDYDNLTMQIEPNRKNREQDLDSYLIARRTIEDLQDREDVEISETQKLSAIESMSKLSSKYGSELEFFDTIAQEVYEYQRTVLINLVDSGVMSKKQYDTIVKENPNYIPFQRVIEKDLSGGISSKGVFTDASSKSIIKRIKGSDKKIKNTSHSIIANTAKILDTSHRNRVAKAIADMKDVLPEYIQRLPQPVKKVKVKDKETGKEIESYVPSDIAPRDSITVYEDGKRNYYKVSKPLLNAMENLGPITMNKTMRTLFSPLVLSARLLRFGATIRPEFWAMNVLRDQGTALMQSPLRPTPVDTIKGLVSVIKKDELYNDWMRNGGAFNSYMELDDKGMEKAYKELFRPEGKFVMYLKNPIHILADISQSLEEATRLGVYTKAHNNNIKGIEAALMAREATLDFARGGQVSKQINQVIPFFNAGVQSVDKLIRTFKENPKAAMFWGVSTITIPSVLLTGYYLYGAPEDERKEYLEIPQWQKDLFWLYKADGQWWRVPKPFSFGYLFGSIPERFMNWGYQGDKPEIKRFWQETASGILGAVSPVYDPSAMIPPLAKVMIENQSNYNFFTGRDIYPAWMERLEPEQRKNKYTSDTATEIGSLFGVSPALVDNALRGSIAGSAQYVTDAGDKILKQVKEWNGQEIPDRPETLNDVPLIRAFAVREPTGYRTESVANFYKNWDAIFQKTNSYISLRGEAEEQNYYDDNSVYIEAYPAMKDFKDSISKFSKLSNLVYDDLDLSSGEKVDMLSEYGAEILNIAREANDWHQENVVELLQDN